jgi:hypothetical protein
MTILPHELNDENFALFAAQHYRNPRVLDVKEFYNDLARFKYVKKLFTKYLQGGELKHRLILNHIISIFNVFNTTGAVSMCFYKLPESSWPSLKTFLLFMDYVDDTDSFINTIGCDLYVAKNLKDI